MGLWNIIIGLCLRCIQAVSLKNPTMPHRYTLANAQWKYTYRLCNANGRHWSIVHCKTIRILLRTFYSAQQVELAFEEEIYQYKFIRFLTHFFWGYFEYVYWPWDYFPMGLIIVCKGCAHIYGVPIEVSIVSRHFGSLYWGYTCQKGFTRQSNTDAIQV